MHNQKWNETLFEIAKYFLLVVKKYKIVEKVSEHSLHKPMDICFEFVFFYFSKKLKLICKLLQKKIINQQQFNKHIINISAVPINYAGKVYKQLWDGKIHNWQAETEKKWIEILLHLLLAALKNQYCTNSWMCFLKIDSNKIDRELEKCEQLMETIEKNQTKNRFWHRKNWERDFVSSSTHTVAFL